MTHSQKIDVDLSAFEEAPAHKRQVPLSAMLYMSAEQVENVEIVPDRVQNNPYKKVRYVGDPEPTKKQARADYNALTRKWLSSQGLDPLRVDHYDHMHSRSHDLAGILDFIAIGTGRTIGIQVTSVSNMSARQKKMKDSAWTQKFLSAGWEVWIVGWEKGANGRFEATVKNL